MSANPERKSAIVLWEVDTQADFMLPGGKLYVPDAEKKIPNMKRLVDAARRTKIFLVSSADQHAPNDPEFVRFPPHCVRGTAGAEIIPQLKLQKTIAIPNSLTAKIPSPLENSQQLILEKQTLDVFDNPAADKIVRELPANCEFIVFGVVTEFCVRLAAKGLLERGRRVALVTDAIETLDAKEGQKTLDELVRCGAILLSTDDALSLLPR